MEGVALIDCNNFYVSCERLFKPNLNGQPVIVLSNNDGCVVSRSQEAKDIGIQMGVPFFQIRDEIKKHGITYFSSNYTLYGDMSARVMEGIQQFSNEVEVYSIDEAFATIEQNAYSRTFRETGRTIRKSVKRWAGIPTSIGIAPTKTLAKIAGDIAKKAPDGVFDLTDERLRGDVLENTDIIDIWGINKALAKRLQKRGIFSAKQLRDMDIRTARKELTVVGARMVEELRGRSCLPMELVQPIKKSITCSRSFAEYVTTAREMEESITNYLSTAAEKLRKSGLIASAVSVFIETNHFRDDKQYSNSGTLKVIATDSTRELLAVALRILRALYRPGFKYKKSGILLLGLQPATGRTQRLFDEKNYLEDRELMKAVDLLNARYGRGAIRFGWPAKSHTNWQMSRDHLSPAYTTNVDQVLRVRA
jgi:DNA polymerase V